MLKNIYFYIFDYQRLVKRAYFFLSKSYGILKNYTYLCNAKHKVIEEYLKLSCPEGVLSGFFWKGIRNRLHLFY